jgi:hypothetical protein
VEPSKYRTIARSGVSSSFAQKTAPLGDSICTLAIFFGSSATVRGPHAAAVAVASNVAAIAIVSGLDLIASPSGSRHRRASHDAMQQRCHGRARGSTGSLEPWARRTVKRRHSALPRRCGFCTPRATDHLL